MFSEKTVEMMLSGRKLKLSTGKIARQAGGSVMLEYGKTTMLVTATMKKEVKEGMDFFPLTVEYIEKFYAAGKFPGGFIKRERRPSDDCILTARLIDRPLRPLFPEGFFHEVQIVVTVLSYDGETLPDAVAIIGASAALTISEIPFHGPVSGVTVGHVDGEFVVNPTEEQMKHTRLDLQVAGTSNAIMMVESGSDEFSEEQLLEAISLAHDTIKGINLVQEELKVLTCKEKFCFTPDVKNPVIMEFLESAVKVRLEEAIFVKGKHAQAEAVDALEAVSFEELVAKLNLTDEVKIKSLKKEYSKLYHDFMAMAVRLAILHKSYRPDGRAIMQIRPILAESNVLPIVHGSGLFTRGETQAIGVVTLGSKEDEQIIEGLDSERGANFYLHYNFPPYSVGEVGRMGGIGRRELGHGNLAQRALSYVLPSHEAFPYTIRIVSEITESNGSSSMASVCVGSMALMDAGVPVSNPVAGIAMGLIKEGSNFVVLSDIQGLEDHIGDMDFKVAGTEKGITALQMDIKIEGITREVMEIALAQAKEGKTHILGEMAKAITVPRAEMKDNVPRIEVVRIAKDKIATLIGPGGKNIREIIEITGAKIDINDEGMVNVFSANRASLEQAISLIKACTSDLEVGQEFTGKVVRVLKFGAIVQLTSNKDGMLHVSEIRGKERIENLEDVIKEGEMMHVKIKEIGKDGKIGLTKAKKD
ncbi:MAG: polyribonucleotide nucleotidyltransferase [Fusobacteria bacterium]|nr:polyribonucleotide nucleotidyltransferase [Fusobacteriota bacterium]